MPIILLFIVAALAVFILSQGVTGISADAPCHCSSETQGCNQVRLTYQELLVLAQNAGFGADSQTAAAIAIAESNVPPTDPPTGNTQAYNPETQAGTPEGMGSYGLWQIYLKAHPEYACIDLTVPENNAQAAFTIYSEAGGFHPWSTFKSGVYQEYLNA